MKLTEEDVRRVADLANLELRDDEIVKMTHDLDGILTHISKLNEVDTSSVEPMTHVSHVLLESQPDATLREDIDRPTLGSAAAVANAPAVSHSGPAAGYVAGYFKVPKVIER